tara:strand:+ start:177 stop:1979 length:1803 start_codon:yes stop_codon:yes gene_type:complete
MNKELINFWKKKSKIIYWKKKPKIIYKNKCFYLDGKTNIAYNCLKNNINNGLGNKIAIITIDSNGSTQKYTFQQLEILVDNFINYLKKKYTIKFLTNNIVAIHSSANIFSAISMLACTKLGLTHCVFFDDLSIDAIKIRLKILKTNFLITNASNKDFNLKITKIKNDLKIKVLHFKKSRLFKNKKKNNNTKSTVYFDDLIDKKEKFHKYTFVKSNKSSFILFTSGSTGYPKGIIHSTGGYLLYSKYTCIKQFGLNKNKTILTASDAGWINGHTYSLYGPLSIGATTILIEKPISLISEKFLKNILFDLKVNILYLPVTLIRLIKSVSSKKRIKSIYLETLGSMGEPLSKYIGQWFAKTFSEKKIQIVNTYYQTETAGIICSPKFNDNISKVPYGSVGKPLSKNLGVFIEKNLIKSKNEIKIKNPWPGCMTGLINKKEKFEKYWDENDNFRMFDVGSLDSNNNFLIHGRTDDVINIRGHRIGSEEIESLLLSNKYIIEVSAIAIDDKLEGSKLVIFLSKRGKKKLDKFINSKISNFHGSFAVPSDIIYIKEMPKTKSGKILRRLLRDIYLNPKLKNYGDLSTMINIDSIQDVKKNVILNKN